jgi:meso-butanediol dehydrogenase/(S,S)-butanediol dehydrogenase/diacetyl reductase
MDGNITHWAIHDFALARSPYMRTGFSRSRPEATARRDRQADRKSVGMSERATERVIVSGATSGIGRTIAVRLAGRAKAIGVMGRRIEAANEGAAEVCKAGCWRRLTGRECGERVHRAQVGLDTVVSSAGITVTMPVKDFGVSAWERIVATNLSGTFYLAKHSLPHLLESKGTFTAISSDAGTDSAPGYGAYCATKHGVIGLIKCMALE